MPSRTTDPPVTMAATAPDLLAVVAEALLERLDDHVDRAVRRTVAAIPTLVECVPDEDLWASMHSSMRTSLLLLAERRGLGDADLPLWHALGERRARQGVLLDDVLQALRIANVALWESLSAAAVLTGEDCPQQVLGQAAQVWNNFDQLCSAIAAGHRDVDAAHSIDLRRKGLALLAALRREDDGEAEHLARTLGLDPSASFVAVVHSPDGEVNGDDLRTVVVDQLERTLVLVQCTSEPPLGELAVERRLQPEAGPAGLGVHRFGLAGARQSIADAEMAFRAAVSLREPVVAFRQQWLACLTLEHRDQQEVLVGDALRVLQADGQARDTLRAYLAEDGSLSATAAVLGLHANTIAYRLRQFAERTGVDARTAEGAALVQVALTLAQADTAGWQAFPPRPAAAS